MEPLPEIMPLPEVVVEWPRSVVVMVPEPDAVPLPEHALRMAAVMSKRRDFNFMVVSLCSFFAGCSLLMHDVNQSGKSRGFCYLFLRTGLTRVISSGNGGDLVIPRAPFPGPAAVSHGHPAGPVPLCTPTLPLME
jgi:hypothetical protein